MLGRNEEERALSVGSINRFPVSVAWGVTMAEILSAPPHGRPALVLNADYRPLSYYPLSLWPWQEVVKAVFLDRVDVIAEYDHVVRSPSTEFRLPSVIALRDFVRQDRPPAFTRFNVFLRDGFQCAYCGAQDQLTFDHVTPRSKGGIVGFASSVMKSPPAKSPQPPAGPSPTAEARSPRSGGRFTPKAMMKKS